MKLSEATKNIHRWIAEDIYVFADMCRQKKIILDEKSYYEFYRSRIGIIGNSFHGKANVNLPYVTEEASKLKSTQRTPEHVNSRLRRAKQILDRVIANPNIKFQRILAYVVDSCKVIQATNEENKKLERRRRIHLSEGNKTIPWRYMYKLEDCTIIERDLKEHRKYYYIIEGLRYDSASDAAEEYEIKPAEVDNRALNKNSWPDWAKYSLDTNARVFRKKSAKRDLVKPKNKKTQKYVYNIDGVVYNSTQELLERYNVNYNTLLSRCDSKKKWPTWLKIRKETHDSHY